MKIQLNRQKKGFTLIELMVVIAILASLAAVGYGPIMEHMNDGDRQQASSNLGQVQKLLLTFSQENGSYPCDATADALLEDERNAEYNFGELKGDRANAYFRQLFYKGNPTEATFYAKHNGTKEPDGKFANGQALTKGENAFAYVLRKESTNPEDAPGKRSVTGTSTPLAFSCVPSSRTPYTGDKLKFNRELFYAHAFMVKTDGAVTDLKDKLQEDSEDDTKSVYADNFTPFPETKKGRDTSPDYIIVTPEL
ncbi:MAG: prepilin-type N-terminal cleavage/methylation domain-containing protein [Akkermansia sp.]|nr:prepilin-type N-terminal cleavage/methylation domain-containing protein [Akkermansia sp.]